MSMKNLLRMWTLPDRSNERIQVTLRIPFTDYARLHALKEVYPSRSVNDILTDIIRVGLDEIVDSLPTRPANDEDVDYFNMSNATGFPGSPYLNVGDPVGPSVDFQEAFRRILSSKSSDDVKKEDAS